MRVGIVALLQESNTFIAERTTLERFEEDLFVSGEAIRDRLADSHHEIGGFFEGLDRAGIEAVPIFAARAMPFGMLTAATFEQLVETMMAGIAHAGRLDGLLLAPHGATVSETYRDADGYWMSLVRERVGRQVPIVCTLDPHGNVSQRMVDACDAMIAYRSNPHLDQRTRGQEAAALMARTLRGEVRPRQALAAPPIAINIQAQRTSVAPCLPIYELADAMRERPGVLSVSIILGFPYADVEEMGSSFVVVTDDDRTLAERLAGELAERLWSHRAEFVGQLIDVEEALGRAAKLEGPICLLDMGDNVGGGSPGDGTHLVHAIHDRDVGPALACLYDPESVRIASEVGIGGQVRLRVGGKTDGLHGGPLDELFTVINLNDGRFEEPEPRHGGFQIMDQGPTAVVRTDQGLTLILTSRRMAPFSLHQLTSCGLDPKSFYLLVAKGVHAPVAAYEPVCRHLIHVNTPGVTTAEIGKLKYRHRRRPMYPFEPDATWPPGEAGR